MSWFTVNRGRVAYRGRITRQPFARWCETKAGRKAIARVAAGMRFSILWRSLRARRRLWRNLDEASRTREFADLLAAEPDRYMQILSDVCYAGALPRTRIGVRRLVLAPRALVDGRAKADIFDRLIPAGALGSLDDDVRAFLLDEIVTEIDAALRGAPPSPARPVLARDGWACVGVRLGTVWQDPLWAGPDGTGHLFMYELPPGRLTRRDCKALEAEMEQMSGAAASLSHAARDAVFRSASVRRA